MLEEVHIIVWVEERLDSISTLDGNVGNVICGIRKNCEELSFAPEKQSSFLTFEQMAFKRKFQGC